MNIWLGMAGQNPAGVRDFKAYIIHADHYQEVR
jgi:hypothetical protein